VVLVDYLGEAVIARRQFFDGRHRGSHERGGPSRRGLSGVKGPRGRARRRTGAGKDLALPWDDYGISAVWYPVESGTPARVKASKLSWSPCSRMAPDSVSRGPSGPPSPWPSSLGRGPNPAGRIAQNGRLEGGAEQW
jgi:hypothetical protein